MLGLKSGIGCLTGSIFVFSVNFSSGDCFIAANALEAWILSKNC